MAQVSKSVIGRLRGSVGDLAFRQRDGKQIISTRPGTINAPDDEDSVNRRLKFRFLTKFASQVTGIDALKAAWQDNAEAGNSAFNQIISDDYDLVSVDSITEQTRLTPLFGFSAGITSTVISASGIQVVTQPIGTNAGIDLNVEKNIQLAVIVCLSSPSDHSLPNYYLVPLLSAQQPLKLDTALTLNASLSNQDALVFPKYALHKTIYALFTLNDDGNMVHYSVTFAIT
ncbi:MAG TPA: hypothetical protein VMU30_11215 [Bacteroidota bacterium]|nr:hypothetical protein [Bacteroidota bacterium]